jgi:ATP-dependent RNA helicase SUPV3L1/SUV3
MKPKAMALRAQLWSLLRGIETPKLPGGGLIAVPAREEWPRGFAETMGWLPAGPVLLRLDVAERIAGEIGHLTRRAPALLPGDLASRLGIKGDVLGPVLDAMGFRLMPAEVLEENAFGPPAPARISHARPPRQEHHRGPRREDGPRGPRRDEQQRGPRRDDQRGPRRDRGSAPDQQAPAVAADGAPPAEAGAEASRQDQRQPRRDDHRSPASGSAPPQGRSAPGRQVLRRGSRPSPPPARGARAASRHASPG